MLLHLRRRQSCPPCSGPFQALARRDIDVLELLRGDILCMITPSGGGFGDQLARDPTRVLEDVLDGLLSPEQARMLYGVVIQDAPGAVRIQIVSAVRVDLGQAAGPITGRSLHASSEVRSPCPRKVARGQRSFRCNVRLMYSASCDEEYVGIESEFRHLGSELYATTWPPAARSFRRRLE